MPTICVTLDDTVVMDGDLGQWTTNPPELITDQLKPGTHPTPWMRALMLTIADAAMTNQSLTITIHTKSDGWDMAVSNS